MFRPRSDDPKWSPYGHEAARRQVLMQRHAYLAVAAIGIALVYTIFLGLTFSVETDVQSGGTVDIQREEQKPMTVTVSPGRAPAFASSDVMELEGQDAPGVEREQEGLILSTIRPFLPVVLPLVGAMWLLSRVGASARGDLAELNFGVYKGAMPYEMHTVSRYKQVFTHRLVQDHIFAKTREDFLPEPVRTEPPISVRRILGAPEAEAAQVTRLRKGRNPDAKRPVPAAAPIQAPALSQAERERRQEAKRLIVRARDAWDEDGFQGVYGLLRKEHEHRQRMRRRAKHAHMLRLRQQAAHKREASSDSENHRGVDGEPSKEGS